MKTWSRWVALLSRREPGTVLALFRVGVGLAMLATFATVWHTGVDQLIWVDRAHGGYRVLGSRPWLVELLGGASPGVVRGLVAAACASAVLLVLGLGSRLAALVALQLSLALTGLNGHAGGSYDDLLANALWLLVLARSDATLSLSCRLRSGRWRSNRPVPSWPRWLAVLQLVLMYASTGSQKLSAHWVPGGDLSALYYILQQPTWQRADMRWLAELYPLTQALTLLTWCWEVGSPLVLLWLWARHRRHQQPRGSRLRRALLRWDLRLPFALVGLAMHLGTLLLLEVGPFSLVSLAFYPCLWHPDELPRWLGGAARTRAARTRDATDRRRGASPLVTAAEG